ncbi:hypothetical protein SAMN05216350_11415 [Polaromonas sp. YR568]|uniref:hypothetical protein n=1 Tax=Polaromonas sp. YR568 TaxID=1855301 RepID=UPI0008F270C2|nr:hypothetical protein [Polaromonas sp. YR568]SFV02197.1 hypothetical protein SAMN05216350_11415 [Polaromonas sp. YR568]
MKTSLIKLTLPFALAAVLTACASGPRPPDWQLEAKGSMDRSVAAYMEGNSRVEMAELERARTQLTRSGRADLLATAELLHCATRVASLVMDEPCAGFDKLRPDATDAQRAYADYLKGQVSPSGIALLPESQRAAAAGNAGALQGITDPLSKLVAAGVMLQTGKASPDVITQAIDTASEQGWRRPLLAWLGVQLRRAEQGGDTQAADKLRRRIELTQGTSAAARPPVTKP